MKQARWQTETEDPYRMLNYLGKRASSRKAMLFACACFRHGRAKLKAWERRVVEIAEREADGQSRPGVFERAKERATGRSGVAWVTYATDYWTAVEAARAAGEWRDEDLQCDLVREIFGNPFARVAVAAALRTPAVAQLARAAYAERELPSGHLDPARLAVLADAVEEAGCASDEILGHLRRPGPHLRGCWALDLLLGKA